MATQTTTRPTSTEDGASEYKTILEMRDGEQGIITQVDGRIHGLASAMGIRPGMRLVVESKQPLDGPVVITVGTSMTSLGRNYAREILVAEELEVEER